LGFQWENPYCPSEGFSIETLTEVTPSWKTELNRVSPPWKTEYPEGCSTTMKCVARKVAAMEGRLV